VSLDQVAQTLLDTWSRHDVIARLWWPQLAPNDAERLVTGHAVLILALSAPPTRPGVRTAYRCSSMLRIRSSP
jgi:hypothetical protein